MAAQAVARLEELEHGVPRIVEVAGRSVLVVRWEETVFAVRNICPHQSQAFVGGQVRSWIYGEPAEAPPCAAAAGAGTDTIPRWRMDVDTGTPVLQCPWHAWEFRLEDGACATDSHFRVRAYDVSVDEEGNVVVDTGRRN